MKQSKHSDAYITEDVLDKKLDEKLKDLPRMDDLHQIAKDLSDLQESKWEESDRRWEENDRKWDENEKRFERLMNGQDRMIKMLEDLSQDNAVGAEQTRELRVEVDNHENRLKKLEAAKN